MRGAAEALGIDALWLYTRVMAEAYVNGDVPSPGMSWEQLPEPVQATWTQVLDALEKAYEASVKAQP